MAAIVGTRLVMLTLDEPENLQRLEVGQWVTSTELNAGGDRSEAHPPEGGKDRHDHVARQGRPMAIRESLRVRSPR
jgi:hypothetical protein